MLAEWLEYKADRKEAYKVQRGRKRSWNNSRPWGLRRYAML